MILFSGKNVKACIIRWLAGGLIPFRMPIFATKERRILSVAKNIAEAYGVPFRAYGYNNLGVDYLPAPPIESAAVSTDFGVAPLDLLGKVFAYTFKPIPIGGRSVSLSGSLSVEFLPEVLSLVWNLDGVTPRRRLSREPTPEYGIQLTATSMLPEFADYCFVIEAHIAIPTRVSIQGSTDRPILSFSMDFYTPYLSWYTDRVAYPPAYNLPVPPYSQNLLTIRDIGINFPTGLWADLLGLVYGFSLSVTKTISPVYTFPETIDFGVNYAVPTTPLVADEWGSVAQSIKEGPVELRLELLCGLASDVNLEVFQRLFGGTNIYYYTREYFFVDINFANLVMLRAAAMVTDLSTSVSPDDAYMVRAVLRLSEPIYVLT